MMRTKSLLFTSMLGFLVSAANTANAADRSALQTKRKTEPVPPFSATYCFGNARCFDLESKFNRFHVVERLKDTPFKVTEIDKTTFANIKRGAADFEAWAKKASAGSKIILECRHEFSVTEGKANRAICLDNVNDKEKSQKSRAFISLFTQAKAIAKAPSAASEPKATPVPPCGPDGPTEDGAECFLAEPPGFPGKK